MKLLSEFVSRWRKEQVDKDLQKKGKEITREIAIAKKKGVELPPEVKELLDKKYKNKRLQNTVFSELFERKELGKTELEKKLAELKWDADERRAIIASRNNKYYPFRQPEYNKKSLTPPEIGTREGRQERIKKLSEKQKNNLPKKPSSSKKPKSKSYITKSDYTGKSSLTKEGLTRLQELREKYKKTPSVSNNPPKVISSVMSTSAINPTNNNNTRQAFNQRLQSVGKSVMKKELLGVAAISGVIGGIALARKVRSDKNKKRGKYRRF